MLYGLTVIKPLSLQTDTVDLNKNLQVPQWHLEACGYSTKTTVGIALIRDNLDVVYIVKLILRLINMR